MAVITIIGAGMMGSALAFPARENGHEVRLVGTHLDGAIIAHCKATGRHPKFDRPFPAGVLCYRAEEADAAIAGCDLVICGVSSFGVEWFSETMLPRIPERTPVLAVTKGLLDLPDGSVKTFPAYWTGMRRRAFGFVRWNGLTYRFLGKLRRARALNQTQVRVTAFGTEYAFEGEGFRLWVEFVSPLFPDDRELASCPVCYTRYRVEADGAFPNDFCVALALHEEFCYSDARAPVVGGVLPLEGFEAAFMTRGRNLVLSNMNDCVAPDWGDTYLAGKESWCVTESAFYQFVATGRAEYRRRELESTYLLATDTARTGCFLTAFDDKVSIFYFGDWYDADSGAIENFINRTVQGGIFAPLLREAFGKGAR